MAAKSSKPAAKRGARKPADTPATVADGAPATGPVGSPSVHTLTPGKTRRHLVADKCPSGNHSLNGCDSLGKTGVCQGLRFAEGVEV